jgi:hypothetical protein
VAGKHRPSSIVQDSSRRILVGELACGGGDARARRGPWTFAEDARAGRNDVTRGPAVVPESTGLALNIVNNPVDN